VLLEDRINQCGLAHFITLLPSSSCSLCLLLF
jgi:hypothetical protein